MTTLSAMQQRAGRLTGTVGGIGAGLIVPFMVQATHWGSRLILALLLLVSLYAIFAPEIGWWYPGTRRIDKATAVRLEAARLADDISAFLAERSSFEPERSGYRTDLGKRAAQHLWEQDNAAYDRHVTETRALYRKRFQNRAVAIFEAAAERGWADPSQRFWVDSGTTNPLSMAEVARIMAKIGSPHR